MLAVGGLQPPAPPPPCPKLRASRNPLFAAKTFSFLPIQIPKASLSAFPLSSVRSGPRLLALNARGNGDLDSRGGFEEEEGDEFDFEDEDDGFEDEDDLDMVVPVEELDEWLKTKPRGFGEGKVYDTSIEDELVREIEQGRRAQLANVAKLKTLPLEPLNKGEVPVVGEVVSTGACVRITHLPKKRKIDRDLKTAFKGISGIANITPLVMGNKKTKDPICKGLAFVNFNSLEDAKRFIDIISRQSITFGKIEKQIKCEIMNSMYNPSKKTVENSNVEGGNKADYDDESGVLLSNDEDDSEESWDTDSLHEDEDVGESLKSFSVSNLDNIELIEQKMMSTVVSLPSKHGDNPQATVKVKSALKKTEKKNTVTKVPVAEKRLKLQKAILASTGDKDEDVRKSFKSASDLDDIERIEQKLLSLAVSLPPEYEDNSQAAAKLKSAQKKSEKKNTVAKIPGAEKRLKLQEKEDSGDEDVDVIESFESFSISMLDDVEQIEVPLPTKHGDSPQAAVKVKSARKKTEKKNTVTKIPAAAKRLKLREKAMLDDVLSRYGSRVASASTES